MHIPVHSLTRAHRARTPAGNSAASCDARHRERRHFLREPVHPWTALAFDFAFAFDLGPPLSRRGRGGSVRKEGAHDARPFANVHGRMSSEPRPALANPQGATSGAASLGLLSLGCRRESDPLAEGKWKLLLRWQIKKIKMDSRLRGNDERGLSPAVAGMTTSAGMTNACIAQ